MSRRPARTMPRHLARQVLEAGGVTVSHSLDLSLLLLGRHAGNTHTAQSFHECPNSLKLLAVCYAVGQVLIQPSRRLFRQAALHRLAPVAIPFPLAAFGAVFREGAFARMRVGADCHHLVLKCGHVMGQGCFGLRLHLAVMADHGFAEGGQPRSAALPTADDGADHGLAEGLVEVVDQQPRPPVLHVQITGGA